ncbi:response regulator transcription factor, partial [Nitrospira defluvii]|nr:response regulator transcription factor [Nitrospira defluvii]
LANKVQKPETKADFKTGDLEIIGEKRQVTLAGKILDLTAKEFDLLWFFINHPGRVFNRSQLLDKVWGYGHDGYEHTVNSHINRLRAKIEAKPAEPRYVLTVWGVGYKFTDLENT